MSPIGIQWAGSLATLGAVERRAPQASAKHDDGAFASRLEQASRDELAGEQGHAQRQRVAQGREQGQTLDRAPDETLTRLEVDPSATPGRQLPVEAEGSRIRQALVGHDVPGIHHHDEWGTSADVRPQPSEGHAHGAHGLGVSGAERPLRVALDRPADPAMWEFRTERASLHQLGASVSDLQTHAAASGVDTLATTRGRRGGEALANLLPSMSLAVSLGVPTTRSSAPGPAPANDVVSSASRSVPMVAQGVPMVAQGAPMVAQGVPMVAQGVPMVAQGARADVSTVAAPPSGDVAEHPQRSAAGQDRATVTVMEDLPGRDWRAHGRRADGRARTLHRGASPSLPTAAPSVAAFAGSKVVRPSTPSVVAQPRSPLSSDPVAWQADVVELSQARATSQAAVSPSRPSARGKRARARGPGQPLGSSLPSMSSLVSSGASTARSGAPTASSGTSAPWQPAPPLAPANYGGSSVPRSVLMVDQGAPAAGLSGTTLPTGEAAEQATRSATGQDRAAVTVMEDLPGRDSRGQGRRGGGRARAFSKGPFSSLQGAHTSADASAGSKVVQSSSQSAPEVAQDLLNSGRMARETVVVEQSEARATSQAAVSSPELSPRQKRAQARAQARERARGRHGRSAVRSANATTSPRVDGGSTAARATVAEGESAHQASLSTGERLTSRQPVGAGAEFAAIAGEQATEFTTNSSDASQGAAEARLGRDALSRAASRGLSKNPMPTQTGDAETLDLSLPRRLRLKVADPKGPWSVDVHDHGRSVDVVVRGEQSLASVVGAAAEDLRSDLPQVGYSLGTMEFINSDEEGQRRESSGDDSTSEKTGTGSQRTVSRRRGPVDPRVIRTI